MFLKGFWSLWIRSFEGVWVLGFRILIALRVGVRNFRFLGIRHEVLSISKGPSHPKSLSPFRPSLLPVAANRAN